MTQYKRKIMKTKDAGTLLDHQGYLDLCNEIKAHMDAYNQGKPDIADFEYDLLMMKLKACESKNPAWIVSDSPTQFVTVGSGNDKIIHDVPMLSIRDVFDYESVRDFVNEVHEKYPDACFSVEHKIDGLSLTLRYERDNDHLNLVLAETRGNGFVGEDVTENAKRIADIPQHIFITDDIDELQVRGEVYMTKSNFERYNEEQLKRGTKLAANPRNLAAGTLSLKDPDEVAYRGLNMFIFNVQKVTGEDANLYNDDHCNALSKLQQKMAIPVVKQYVAYTADEVIDAIEKIAAERSSLPFDIDGAVVKLAEVGIRDDFSGGSAKYANGHIAYKYPQEAVDVTIDAVEVAVGRTGKLSYTAVVHDTATGLPAQVCGTSVERVTVNNPDYIRTMSIGIGGRYELIKSGEIIPKIIGIIKAPEKVFEAPETCPCCGALLRKHKGADGKMSVDIFCDNIMCSSKALARLTYFAGRNQMNIDGLSEKKIAYLLENDYIRSAVDLYKLATEYKNTGNVLGEYSAESLMVQEGWGYDSVDNLMNAIDKSRDTNFVSFMAAQGIPGFGHGQAKLVAPAIISWARTNPEGAQISSQDSLIDALARMVWCDFDFTSIDGIGPVVAKALVEWVDTELNDTWCRHTPETNTVKLLNEVRFTDVYTDYVKEFDADSKIAGKTFCITGSVNHYANRDELKAEIESLGGKVTGSVTKKTDYLINNDVNSTSGKNAKAKELGVAIISEDEYIAMK